MAFKLFSNRDLLEKTQIETQREREQKIVVLRHFAEIEKRRCFHDAGYASLYALVTKAWKYSEGSAHRRISAMRLMRTVPNVDRYLCDGRLSMTVAAAIHVFAKRKGLDPSRLVELCLDKSSREAERIMLGISPDPLPRESLKVVGPEHTQLTIVLHDSVKAKLDRLRAWFSHARPLMNYVDVIDKIADLGLIHFDPARPRRASVSSKGSITAEVRAQVWRKAESKCEYVFESTGERCCSTFQLEIDHIDPLAMGGSNDLTNLRLVCQPHNQQLAIEKFGKEHMSSYINF